MTTATAFQMLARFTATAACVAGVGLAMTPVKAETIFTLPLGYRPASSLVSDGRHGFYEFAKDCDSCDKIIAMHLSPTSAGQWKLDKAVAFPPGDSYGSINNATALSGDRVAIIYSDPGYAFGPKNYVEVLDFSKNAPPAKPKAPPFKETLAIWGEPCAENDCYDNETYPGINYVYPIGDGFDVSRTVGRPSDNSVTINFAKKSDGEWQQTVLDDGKGPHSLNFYGANDKGERFIEYFSFYKPQDNDYRESLATATTRNGVLLQPQTFETETFNASTQSYVGQSLVENTTIAYVVTNAKNYKSQVFHATAIKKDLSGGATREELFSKAAVIGNNDYGFYYLTPQANSKAFYLSGGQHQFAKLNTESGWKEATGFPPYNHQYPILVGTNIYSFERTPEGRYAAIESPLRLAPTQSAGDGRILKFSPN